MIRQQWFHGTLALVVAASLTTTCTSATILSDSFSRSPAGTPVGTPPLKDTSNPNPAGWVSDWGANNNSSGGYVTQTYTTYNDAGKQYKTDGTNGISGNWLNNGSPAHPLKLANAATTITEPIGITGFAWTQVNYDFAADSFVTATGAMRINFDLYRSPSGNISWFFGNDQQNGQNNGNAGSPATVAANDIALYWRGTQAATYGLRDNGSLPAAVPGIASYDTISYNGSPNLNTLPIPMQIDITGTNFTSGQTSMIELTVAGVLQDLNGTAAGSGYSFTWDSGGAAYMGFGSNSTPVEGTNAAPIFRAAGIDNLVVSAVPEPACFVLLLTGVLACVGYRQRRGFN